LRIDYKKYNRFLETENHPDRRTIQPLGAGGGFSPLNYFPD
jgi:hypothetical protein